MGSDSESLSLSLGSDLILFDVWLGASFTLLPSPTPFLHLQMRIQMGSLSQNVRSTQ